MARYNKAWLMVYKAVVILMVCQLNTVLADGSGKIFFLFQTFTV